MTIHCCLRLALNLKKTKYWKIINVSNDGFFKNIFRIIFPSWSCKFYFFFRHCFRDFLPTIYINVWKKTFLKCYQNIMCLLGYKWFINCSYLDHRITWKEWCHNLKILIIKERLRDWFTFTILFTKHSKGENEIIFFQNINIHAWNPYFKIIIHKHDCDMSVYPGDLFLWFYINPRLPKGGGGYHPPLRKFFL